MKKRNSIFTSIPGSRKVCGYEIKKMPIGAFLKATSKMQEIPGQLMEAVFPGEGLDQILARLKAIDKDSLPDILVRAITALPEQIISLFADLCGIPEEELINDENIGIGGLANMIQAWIEVNDLENFTGSARAIAGKARALLGMTAGSKG